MQMVVALDNAEHLLDDVAVLAQALLDAAPALRLIVTSQAPLRLAAERVWRLGPLAIPHATLPAHEAQAFAAVALFAERASAADSRFVLGDAQVPAVIALCRQLDGLALAIELAAARAPSLGVEKLVASMGDRLRLLTSNRNRQAPGRQQTLRAALEWSHALLKPAEQRLFRRLAVLAGSAPLERLSAIAADPLGEPDPQALLDEWALVDALDQLVQRSLVELVFDERGGHPRYRLLESPRALALERLVEAAEEAPLRRRHALAVRAAWEADEQDLYGGRIGVHDWRAAAEAELADAREAMKWARESGEDTLALALAAAMLARLPMPLHEERITLAQTCDALIARVDDARVRERAWSAIRVAWANQRPALAMHAAAQALALARELDPIADDRFRLYDALCESAGLVADEAEATRAEALLAEARAIEDPAWPPVRLRSAARLEARIAGRRGDPAALPLMKRLLTLSRAAGDPSLATLLNISDTELWLGDAPAAARTARALVQELAQQRAPVALVGARVNLAAALIAAGEFEPARAELRRAWPLAVTLERSLWCADYLALLAALAGRFDAAARLLGAADARYAAAQDDRQQNEAAARARTLGLLQAALAPAALESLLADGATCSDDALAAIGFQGMPEPGRGA
jgi:predicted ATPase